MIDFRIVSLSEVLEPANRWFAPELATSYRQLGVRLWGQGAYEREQVTGAGTKYEKLNLCKTNDIVVNKIWARNGSVAVVDQHLDGSVVSNEFPLFTTKQALLSPEWFRLFTQTPSLWNQCDQLARGTSGQNRIRPENFLRVQIPLPSLDDQREVVTKVHNAFKELDEAERLAGSIAEDFNRLLIAMAHRDSMFNATTQPMSKVAPLVRRPVLVDLEESYPEVGVRSFGKGTFHKPPLAGADVGTKKLFWIQPGDLVFQIVFAWEGAVAIAKPEDFGRCGSHRFLTCVCDTNQVLADWLLFYFLSPIGLARLGEASPGGAGRNRTLGIDKLARMQVPVPPMEHQIKIASVMDAKRRYFELNTFEKDAKALRRSILAKAFRGEL